MIGYFFYFKFMSCFKPCGIPPQVNSLVIVQNSCFLNIFDLSSLCLYGKTKLFENFLFLLSHILISLSIYYHFHVLSFMQSPSIKVPNLPFFFFSSPL